MRKDVLGIIFCNSQDAVLNDLTAVRAVGSVPFGGRYRLVDFALSQLVNAGISKVGLVTKQNFKSLADHVGSGRPWDLARKKGGLSMLTPFAIEGATVYKGKIDALNGAMDYIEDSGEEYVVITSANIVSSFSIEDMIEAHIASGSDMTVAYKDGISAAYYIKIENGRLISICKNKNNSDHGCLECLVIKRELLIELIKEASSHNYTDFAIDIINRKADTLNINCYEIEGYAKVVTTVQEFFEINMDMIDTKNREELFSPENPVFTKLRDEMPTKYGFDSKVENSLVAEGCIIEGEVKNSIIFRGVKIGKGVKIENSIIMQSCQIGDNTQLDYIIADKNVVFNEGRTLMGCRSFPMVIGKGLTV